MPPPIFLVNQFITLHAPAEATDPSRHYRKTTAPPGEYRIVNLRRYEGYRHDFEHGDGYLYRISPFLNGSKEFNVWQHHLLAAKPASEYPRFP